MAEITIIDVGLPMIDDQHRKLIDLSNGLLQAMINGMGKEFPETATSKEGQVADIAAIPGRSSDRARPFFLRIRSGPDTLDSRAGAEGGGRRPSRPGGDLVPWPARPAPIQHHSD